MRATPPSANRTGRSVRLVPVEVRHNEFLYSLATSEEIGFRWTLGGQVPRRETFELQLWNGVLSQFIVCNKTDGAPIGVVVCYNAELNHGIAHLGAAMVSEAIGSGVGIEAVDLFVGYLFQCFDLRKMYFDVPEYNINQLETMIGTILHKEGVLKSHFYYSGRHWDKVILAVYRDEYLAIGSGQSYGRRRRLAS